MLLRRLVNLLEVSPSSRAFVRSFFRCYPRRMPKPCALPPSMRVRYKVRKSYFMDVDDTLEFMWRRQVYQDALASIRSHFKAQLADQLHRESLGIISSAYDAVPDMQDKEFLKRLKENDDWNKQTAELRSAREKEEIKAEEDRIHEEVNAFLSVNEHVKAENEQRVKAITERSANFITSENLHNRIQEALESPVDYSYAIDVNGNIYKGNLYAKYLMVVHREQKSISEHTFPCEPKGKFEPKRKTKEYHIYN